ncbi:hypothetical protein L1987_52997 [Smallanthus sonchifolius]|uniref:Uncharacterized protein n=1 Tax=Smallanthus sonchifolius TaxID=185202 RepID=A0ACB9EV01_9ASTR|nr:hypothetical protein L1987_52997 [Smallanthus sonchifolius]
MKRYRDSVSGGSHHKAEPAIISLVPTVPMISIIKLLIENQVFNQEPGPVNEDLPKDGKHFLKYWYEKLKLKQIVKPPYCCINIAHFDRMHTIFEAVDVHT